MSRARRSSRASRESEVALVEPRIGLERHPRADGSFAAAQEPARGFACAGVVLAPDSLDERHQNVADADPTIAIADTGLQAELAERHPEVWSRIQLRREFLTEQLGVEIGPNVLPLSAFNAYLPPLWLSPDHAFQRP